MEKGSFVVAHLVDPREQLWGRVESLTTAGVTLRCITMDQIQDYRYQFRAEERSIFPATTFFPMRRVEKIYVDETNGDLPSIKQNIQSTARVNDDELLSP